MNFAIWEGLSVAPIYFSSRGEGLIGNFMLISNHCDKSFSVEVHIIAAKIGKQPACTRVYIVYIVVIVGNLVDLVII